MGFNSGFKGLMAKVYSITLTTTLCYVLIDFNSSPLYVSVKMAKTAGTWRQVAFLIQSELYKDKSVKM